MSDIQRVKAVCKWLIYNDYADNDKELAELIGYTKSSFSQIMNGKVPVSAKFMNKLCEVDVNINKVWVFKNEGQMLNVNPTFLDVYPKDRNLENGIPLIPLEAISGSGKSEFVINEFYVESYYKIPNFKFADFLVRVAGSSMLPKLSNGDIMACKKLILKDIYFEFNRIYVLDTTQGALIKKIKKGSDKNHVLIVSENQDYEPFELLISKINAVAIVIGIFSLE